jgi:hypothetical protein
VERTEASRRTGVEKREERALSRQRSSRLPHRDLSTNLRAAPGSYLVTVAGAYRTWDKPGDVSKATPSDTYARCQAFEDLDIAPEPRETKMTQETKGDGDESGVL